MVYCWTLLFMRLLIMYSNIVRNLKNKSSKAQIYCDTQNLLSGSVVIGHGRHDVSNTCSPALSLMVAMGTVSNLLQAWVSPSKCCQAYAWRSKAANDFKLFLKFFEENKSIGKSARYKQLLSKNKYMKCLSFIWCNLSPLISYCECFSQLSLVFSHLEGIW